MTIFDFPIQVAVHFGVPPIVWPACSTRAGRLLVHITEMVEPSSALKEHFCDVCSY